ncbi:ATP-binding protein [Donghicola tyrosinivorans]|uniref:histidine kinase n=1 Tax=Donghicola tyrosinivorans TaxID=1652492 RepID=A0A2T0WGN5_9RHOB|nr:ATP-binding protein [Donghicola tyrosinivorans]PRY85832.1 two-component system osmolarity sensor histidine kinase EnvZ [Donghicola tyrosinivorans]
MFLWLKRYMPNSLYGRAALILILPVLTVQLVVSVTFIQRHFEGVTQQLSKGLALDLAYVATELSGLPEDEIGVRGAELTEPFQLAFEFLPSADAKDLPSRRRIYDFSGLVVIETLKARLPNLLTVDLPDDRSATTYLQLENGVAAFGFDRNRVSALNPHQLLVWSVAVGFLMTVIAYFFLRNQLRPIKRMASAAEAFGKGQHIAYKPSGAIEVRAAGNAFLDMRARIERQIDQRTLMLSGVSHDLRTPLTRLKLGLSMIEDDMRDDLLRDVDDMQHLLNEFLNFARGEAEGEAESVDPGQLVAQLVSDFQREGKNVSLLGIEGEGVVTLRPVAIRRALENLVGNAVRYGSTAQVSCWIGERSVRFRVEDDGPGIPNAKRAEAIKPFARLDPSRNQNKGMGLGLGLAIVTDIARAHGGSLRLDQSPDMGGLLADLVLPR